LFLIAIVVAIADQLTKILLAGKNFPVIGNFLAINYAENTGMGFGMMQGYNTALAFLTLVFIGAVLYYYDRIPKENSLIVFVGLLVGGALGNFIDRIAFGFVRDFIAFSFWPSFNIADAAITIGGIGIIIYFWRKKK